jgi:outer membrane protein OmpA-like peptidoglycan-associated protein
VYVNDTVFVASPKDTVYLMRPKVNTIYNFPGTLFIVNTDEFNNSEPGNMGNLYNIKTLVNQCPDLKVEIQGHASNEGTAERNQELSEMRARKIRSWLIEQGVSSSKIASTVGYGTSRNAVTEPTNGSAAELEAARVQNRRIAVKVVETCK